MSPGNMTAIATVYSHTRPSSPGDMTAIATAYSHTRPSSPGDITAIATAYSHTRPSTTRKEQTCQTPVNTHHVMCGAYQEVVSFIVERVSLVELELLKYHIQHVSMFC